MCQKLLEVACGCWKSGKGGGRGDRGEVVLLSHAITLPSLTDGLILTDDLQTHSLSLLTYMALSL